MRLEIPWRLQRCFCKMPNAWLALLILKNTSSSMELLQWRVLPRPSNFGTVYSACERILGFRKHKNRDWLDENDVTIQSLLESKSKAYNALYKCVTGFHELSLKSRFNSIKTKIQRKLRKMQNIWWSMRDDEIQLAADTKNTKVFYSLLREVYGSSSFSITPLRSKDNKHLIRTHSAS